MQGGGRIFEAIKAGHLHRGLLSRGKGETVVTRQYQNLQAVKLEQCVRACVMLVFMSTTDHVCVIN